MNDADLVTATHAGSDNRAYIADRETALCADLQAGSKSLHDFGNLLRTFTRKVLKPRRRECSLALSQLERCAQDAHYVAVLVPEQLTCGDVADDVMFWRKSLPRHSLNQI